LTFTGSAIAITGGLSPAGGRADVYLDGHKLRTLDAYVDGATHENVLWHTYGLKLQPHTLRVVVRNDADARAVGKKLVITEAVVYRPK
jgi:hypothetical protein